MKVISIWQPFASLIMARCKVFETRGWPAPASVIGTRIGIASTKNVVPGQRAHIADPDFIRFYEMTGQPVFEELPFGHLLGTVFVDSVELMTEEFLEDVSDEEQAYGWWELGNFAWRLSNPEPFDTPIPIKGKQGLYEWRGLSEAEERQAPDPKRKTDIRRHLRVV